MTSEDCSNRCLERETLDGIDDVPYESERIDFSQHQIVCLPYDQLGPVHVCVNGNQETDTGVEGGGVAGTRISPECRFFMESEEVRKIIFAGDADLGFDAVVELGCGHGCLGAWTAWKLKEVMESRSSSKSTGSKVPPVYLTDVPAFLTQAKVTAAANNEKFAANSMRVAALTFGNLDELEQLLSRVVEEYKRENGSDSTMGVRILLIGAAVTFWECVFAPLAQTLHHFLNREIQEKIGYRAVGNSDFHAPTILLSHFRRDWGCEKRFYTKMLSNSALRMTCKDHVSTIVEAMLEDSWHLGGADGGGLWAPICSRHDDADWNVRVWGIRQPPCAEEVGSTQLEQHDAEHGYDYSNGFKSKADKALEAKIWKEQEQQRKREEKDAAKGKKGKNKK